MNFEAIIYILKLVGIGLLTGAVIGFIFKKVSKMLVFIIAAILILIQLAVYNGYIQVDWLYWKDTAVAAVKNAKIPSVSIKEIAMRNIPFSIGAIIGFIFGISKG
jgi:uncharacterized membrane protein (Fun14 family)